MTNEKLNAYLDGELSEPERRDFELQLERDPNLRAELEQLQSLDGMLRNEYKQSAGIAESTISKLTIPEKRRVRAAWFALPLAAAAGLVLGILIQKNTGETAPAQTPDSATKLVSDAGKSETNINIPKDLMGCSLPEHQSIGMITLATAPVSIVDNNKMARDCKIGEPIVKGSNITTPPAVRAAIAFNDGSELRLDRDTRVEITDKRQLTIQNGRVWLRVAPGEPFVVLVNNARVESPAGETICSVQPDRAAVEQYKESVSVTLGQDKKIVKEFESIEIASGKLGDARPFYFDEFATAWMLELRMLAGMSDEDVVAHVNGLFEALGRAKGIDAESELLAIEIAESMKAVIERYVANNRSYLRPELRASAERILADVAKRAAGNRKKK